MKKRTILIWILISISINLFAVSAETTFFDNLNDAFIIGNPEQEGSESTQGASSGGGSSKKDAPDEDSKEGEGQIPIPDSEEKNGIKEDDIKDYEITDYLPPDDASKKSLIPLFLVLVLIILLISLVFYNLLKKKNKRK